MTAHVSRHVARLSVDALVQRAPSIGRAYVRDQIAEIRRDPVLSWYGASLCSLNLVTIAFWSTYQPIGRLLTSEAICWPFFEGCAVVRPFAAAVIKPAVVSLAIGSVFAAVLFLLRRTAIAYLILCAATAVKMAIVAQDYRLALNQHYMAAWVTAVYLAVPTKRRTILWLLVAFYTWAGTLKLTPDWLSGAALNGGRPFNLPTSLVPLECAYVVVLELCMSAGLLAHRTLIWASVLVQLVVFHIASYWIVGFFYPLLMFCLLSIVPLSKLMDDGEAAQPSNRRRIPLGPTAIVAVFSLLQLVPRAIPGDAAVTGEGRMFALNMFDAPVRCRATTTEDRRDDPTRVVVPLTVPYLQPRIACDPIVYWQAAQRECERRSRGNQRDFDLELRSVKGGEKEARTIVSIPGVCAAKVSYSLMWRNAWIKVDRRE